MGSVPCSAVAAKEILIIAGPNGAGKTTFAFRYLGLEQRGISFVNADLIASGFDPTKPGRADIQAGRLMLAELDRHADEGGSFAFETTLSGRGYLRRIRRWRADGYGVSLIFLSLPSAEDAVRRRFAAGLRNLRELYSHEVDSWVLYDNIEEPAIELERSPDHDCATPGASSGFQQR